MFQPLNFLISVALSWLVCCNITECVLVIEISLLLNTLFV